MQYIQLAKDVKQCKETYNKEMADIQNRFKQIQSLSVALGEESSAFASHNLDLQEGLLNTMDKVEKLEVKNAKLESKAKRNFSIGPYVGYDPITKKESVGLGIQYKIISF
jgi:vacuolar-type H+-ATPase subunit D/Vma8